ncbi:MAG TPA: class III extradiol ring-cleavage dioxygenase [Polyangiaceae bacterium]|jgi:4,5-DOPA dioxygenase extradiol
MSEPRGDSRLISRRSALGAALTLGVEAALPRFARAAEPGALPALYVTHSPKIPLDPVRRSELGAWGKQLPRARGIIAMTPHFATRELIFGPTGRGFAMYNLPLQFKRQLPQDLDYPSPPSEALAVRVEALLDAKVPRSDKRGLEHTTWMPLLYMYPEADAPVLEIAYPYRSEAELFAFGQKLAPLRQEGIVIFASGSMTHNLASAVFDPKPEPPAWAREFDAWAAEVLKTQNVDALLDWRHKAPAAELAHPDDGGHFRVLLLALGSALTAGAPPADVRFPVTGFEGSSSKRSLQLG